MHHIVMTPWCFRPSEVLVRLLHKNVTASSVMSEDYKKDVCHYAREQMRFHFANTIYEIRVGKIFMGKGDYWLVDRFGGIRKDFVEAIEDRIDWHWASDFKDEEFLLRFGEDVSVWFLNHEQLASSLGMVIDKNHRIVVQREYS